MSSWIDYVVTKEDPVIKIRLGIFETEESNKQELPVIIVPGWLSAIDNFTAMAKAMQEFRTAIIYEPRGFGESLTPHKKGLLAQLNIMKNLGKLLNT